MRARVAALIVVLAVLAGCLSGPGGESLLLASTTSPRDTGLLDVLEREFEQDTGVELRYVAVGSGQALALGRRGDADALLVHSPTEEAAFVAAGQGLWRRPVMRNEFILVGPPADPAGVMGETNVSRALLAIHDARALFASRGDQSGTHSAERGLWARAGLDPATFDGAWYKETGGGMASTLRYAAEVDAYALADEGTWVKLRAAGEVGSLTVVTRGDPALRNEYSVIPVSQAAHPSVEEALAVRFAEWLTGERGQAVIGGFTAHGVRLFTPVAEGA